MLFNKHTLKKTNEAVLKQINKRRRQILVHSYLYYKRNTSLISDFTFDSWCRELVSLHKTHPNETALAVFPDAFKGWSGFSGYDLFKNDRFAEVWAFQKGEQLLNFTLS